MSKNLFAFVTFGGLEFTKLLVNSIRETVLENDYEIFAIVGKPGDTETPEYLKSENIPYKVHKQNMGFPYGLNDIYDYAWDEKEAYKRYCAVEFSGSAANLFKFDKDTKYNRYSFDEFKNLDWLKNNFTFDNLIISGNDVILYPYAGDSLINLANTSEYKVISGLQYDVRDLCGEYPEAKQYFSGSDYVINDFSAEPWRMFTGYSKEPTIADMQLFDIQNCCLYKKEYFDEVGYTDVNFYPAYFVDNDLARRIVISGMKCCSLVNARFFHFWSRVIKQGSGGSNHAYFERNAEFYKWKWGGPFGKETKAPKIKISDRAGELDIVEYWRNK